jgi:rRNA maturation endonuclease Nob1
MRRAGPQPGEGERMAKIKVICLECGKKFQVVASTNECPRCGGTDIDVRHEPEDRTNG